MNDDSGSIRETLLSIKALMENEGATEGEKIAARSAFDRLLKKYHLSEKDLLDEEKEWVDFRFRDDYERDLLLQVAYKVIGPHGKYTSHGWSGRRLTKSISILLTKTERAEIEFLYSLYLSPFRVELERMRSAFFHANNIFPEKSEGVHKELTREEKERLLKLLDLAGNITPTPIFKQLGEGKKK